MRSLEVLLVGALGEDPTLGERVSSWFDPAQFRVVVRRAPALDSTRVLAPTREHALSVWVSVEGASAHLYFAAASAEGGAPRFLLRKLSLENGLDEMGAERVAEVVHLSAVALLEGEQSSERAELARNLDSDGATQPEERSQPDASSRAQEQELERLRKATPSATNWEFGLGYGVSYHSEEGYWHGPRASAALRLGDALDLSISAQTGLPASHDLGELELRIQALLLTVGIGFRRALGAASVLEARVGLGLDVVDYRPLRSALAGVELGSGAIEARPNLMAGAGVVLGRSPFRVALFAEAALSLSNTRYDLADGERTRVIAEPSPFIPRLGAEARF